MDYLCSAVYMQLKKEKKKKIVTEGDCMRPIINNKDIVEVSISPQYRVGDIVLVLVQNQLRIHRIISKDRQGYRTKGDHSFMADRGKNNIIFGRAVINNSQNCSLCSNRMRMVSQAAVSGFNGRIYRKYLKTNKRFWKSFYLKMYNLGDRLLFCL